MKNLLFILLIPLYTIFGPSAVFAVTPYITDPDIKIIDNNIIVKTSITSIAGLDEKINSGIGKEIIFTIELMRLWNFWPDEFVVSKKIRKVIKYDNLRNHYLVSSRDGTVRTDIKFTDFDTMKNRIFSVDPLSIANIKELDPGRYYIRVIVESKSRERLPLIGLLMHLLPEVEMSLARESQPFAVGTAK